jgi:hypothetical protein
MYRCPQNSLPLKLFTGLHKNKSMRSRPVRNPNINVAFYAQSQKICVAEVIIATDGLVAYTFCSEIVK